MAGHNKWSKVKHIKAVVDAKRGKIFSKFSKELTLAAKHGGSNPETNARLRTAIQNARAQNMPGDNIERAIKKGAGELAGASLDEVIYEGYGPGGAAILIEVVTDNRNRSVNDVRMIFSKNGGTFAEAGSVAYLFSRRGEIRLDNTGLTEDAATELALESGADDVIDDGGDWILTTAQDRLFAVGAALQARGVTPKSQQLVYVPSITVPISDSTVAKSLIKLHDALDDYDDTQNVHSNFEIPDEILAQID
jgi:YebC/PmpR family DNA-binding regulatory protein